MHSEWKRQRLRRCEWMKDDSAGYEWETTAACKNKKFYFFSSLGYVLYLQHEYMAARERERERDLFFLERLSHSYEWKMCVCRQRNGADVYLQMAANVQMCALFEQKFIQLNISFDHDAAAAFVAAIFVSFPYESSVPAVN